MTTTNLTVRGKKFTPHPAVARRDGGNSRRKYDNKHKRTSSDEDRVAKRAKFQQVQCKDCGKLGHPSKGYYKCPKHVPTSEYKKLFDRKPTEKKPFDKFGDKKKEARH